MSDSKKRQALDAVVAATGLKPDEVLRRNPELAEDLPDSAARRKPRGPGSTSTMSSAEAAASFGKPTRP